MIGKLSCAHTEVATTQQVNNMITIFLDINGLFVPGAYRSPLRGG